MSLKAVNGAPTLAAVDEFHLLRCTEPAESHGSVVRRGTTGSEEGSHEDGNAHQSREVSRRITGRGRPRIHSRPNKIGDTPVKHFPVDSRIARQDHPSSSASLYFVSAFVRAFAFPDVETPR